MKDYDFSNINILVFGDIMLDKYYLGEVNRISPEAPVPILKVKKSITRLGGAANTVNNVVNLNAKSTLIGAAGKDKNRKLLEKRLKELKVKYYLIDTKIPTITKTRIIGDHQQIVRVDFEEIKNIGDDYFDEIMILLNKVINNIDIIIISDYGKGICSFNICKFIIKKAIEKKINIIIDPNGNNWDKYRNATIITPNLQELSSVIGEKIKNEDQEIKKYGVKIIDAYKITHLIVTRADKGMTLISRNIVKHFKVNAKEVYDVSGAGDTVVAVLSVAIASGVDLYKSIELANRAGEIVVGKVGTATIYYDELFNNYSNSKIIDKKKVLQIVKKSKSQDKKIVFTNGCFDILHKGHISYLKEAKKLGDILIVGLNSDNSVKRLKGEKRPIKDQDTRSEILSYFEFIDYIIIFDEDTPYSLIKSIKPNFLVKGSDYKYEEIIGKEFADKTIIIPLLGEYSTTNLLNSNLNK